MAELNWFDYVLIVVVTVSTLISLFRGFFKEALSLATWVVAVWLAWKFGTAAEGLLQAWVADPVLLGWLSRGLVFIGALLLGGIVSTLVAAIVAGSGLSGTDRALGMVFGAARGVLLVGLLLAVLQALGFAQSAWWYESKLIPYAAPVTDFILHLAQDGMQYLDSVSLPESS